MDLKPQGSIAGKLLRQLVVAIIFVLLLAFMLILLFYQYDHQQQFKSATQLPATQAALDLVTKQQAINQQLIVIGQLSNAKQLAVLHQQLSTLALPVTNQQQAQQLDQLSNGIVSRLANASMTNDQLYLSLLASLSTLTALANELNQPLWHSTLSGWHAIAKTIDLQTPSGQFEQFIRQLNNSLELFSLQLEEQSASYQTFEQALTQLQLLLVGEQSYTSRWRGYIRLYQQYINSVNDVFAEQQQVFGTIDKLTYSPSLLEQLLVKVGISIAQPQLLMSLATLVGLTLIGFIIVLARMINIARRHNRQIISDIEQSIAGDFQQPTTEETSKINEQLQKLSLLEQDHRTLQQKLTDYSLQQVQLLALADCVQWFIKDKQLHFLLPEHQHNAFSISTERLLHWPSLLGYQQSKAVIKASREAKAKEDIIQQVVIIDGNITLKLVIAFDEYWLGTLIDGNVERQQQNVLIYCKHNLLILSSKCLP